MSKKSDQFVYKRDSLLSRITFFWIIKLFKRGAETKLESSDLNDIDPFIKSENIGQEFNPKSYKTSNFIHSLWRLIWIPMTIATILELISVTTEFLSPYILGKILDFISIEKKDQYFLYGFILSLIYCLIIVFRSIIGQNSHYFLQISEIRIETGLKQSIYKKFLKLTSESRREYNLGKLNNLLGGDSSEVSLFSTRFINFFIDPIRIICGIYFLWQYIGIISIATIFFSIIFGLLTHFLSKKTKETYENMWKLSGQKSKTINEMFASIKIIKLFAWEKSFINKIKSKELEDSKVLTYWNSGKVINICVSKIVVSKKYFSDHLKDLICFGLCLRCSPQLHVSPSIS